MREKSTFRAASLDRVPLMDSLECDF